MATSAFYNRVVFIPFAGGTADFIVRQRAPGARAPQDIPIPNNTLVSYTAVSFDLVQWEAGQGTYISATNTVRRTTLRASSTGAFVNFNFAPTVQLDYHAEDIVLNQGGISNAGNPPTTVDGQIALFSGTTGALIKAATGTGVVHATNGVYSSSQVTLAEIVDTAAARLLGNPTGAPAAPSEISLASDTNVTIAFAGTTLQMGWSGTLSVARGGSGTGTLTNHGVLLGQGTGAIVATAAMTDGQLLVGQSGADPLPKTLSTDATLAASGALTIANQAVTYAKIQNISATSRILSRRTAGAGSTEESTLSQILDFVGSAADGDLLYRSAGAWTRLPIGSTTNVLTVTGALPVWAAASGGTGSMTRRTISGADTAGTTDKGNIIEVTSGTFTLAFTAAATLTNGWWSIIFNHGTGDVALDPNGAETIDGLTTWVLYPGGAILVQCDGSAFHSVLLAPMRKQFDANGTFTKPGVGTFARIQGWGGGASGGRGRAAATAAGGGGGGGGTFNEALLLLSSFGATETVTIGAGGAAQTVDSTAGNVGGNTTFGALLTAFGGGAGGGGVNGSGGTGGGGGGAQSVGAVGNSGGQIGGVGGNPTPGLTDGTTFLNSGGAIISQAGNGNVDGGGGGGGAAANAPGNAGGVSSRGGGGGASGGANGQGGAVGGSSIWGGGGGGGGGSGVGGGAAGGTSTFGGNGGSGSTGAVVAGTGVQPGGGGGGSANANSGAGAAGRAIIWIW